MQVISTKEEFIYRLVIQNINLETRQNGGYFINIMLTGIPKDRYDTKQILKILGHVQRIAGEQLDKVLEEKPNISNRDLIEEIKTRVKNILFQE